MQVVAECDKAAKWLAEKQAAQGSLRQTDDPVLTAEDLRKREGTVLRFCEPLLSKPPPPPKVPTLALPLYTWQALRKSAATICCKPAMF